MAEEKNAHKAADDQVHGSQSSPKRIFRSQTDRYLAGVCGGFANYFQIDPFLVRIIWVAATFIGGTGLFAYIAAWILIPENPTQEIQTVISEPERSRKFSLALGIVLIFVGLLFLGDNLRYHFMFPWGFRGFDFGVLIAMAVIGIGVYVLFMKSPADETSASNDAVEGSTSRAKKLTRSVTDRKVAGVCGGLAKYFSVDPAFVRIGCVVLALAQFPLVIIVYIIMMIVVPEDGNEAIVN